MPDAQAGWHRLPKASIISFGVIQLIQAIRHGGWQALIPLLAITGLSGGEATGLILALNFALLGVLLLILGIFAVLAYRNFSFQSDAHEIRVRKGVFTKSLLSLPYERVQTYKTRHPIYLRPFYLVDLKLESAGSKGEEIRLPGIPHDHAQDLLNQIFTAKGQSQAFDTNTDTTDDKTHPLIHLTIGDLLKHGLISRQVFILFAAIAGIAGGAFDVVRGWWGKLYTYLDNVTQGDISAQIILAVLVITIMLGAGLLISIALTLIRYYDFQLQKDWSSFKLSHGLFERHERSLKRTKVQCVRYSQSLTARLLNRKIMHVVQAGGGEAQSASTTFPALSAEQSHIVTSSFLPDLRPDALHWHRVLPSYAYMLFSIYVFPIALLLIFGLMKGELASLAFIPLALLIWPLCKTAQRNRQYAFTETHGASKGGLFGRWGYVFPLYKVQTVSVLQNPIQHLRGNATLLISLAGANISIPAIRLSEANRLRDYLLYKVEADQRRWM